MHLLNFIDRGSGKGFRRLIFLMLWVAVSISPLDAVAQQQVQPAQAVDVGIYVSPPFVMGKDGHYSGMAIDLWQVIAGQEGLATRYRLFHNLQELLTATEQGEVAVAVTNLTITQDRAQKLSFTQPWYDAGLRIMVQSASAGDFWDIVSGLRESGHLRIYAWLGSLVLVATVLMTLFDRRFDRDFPKRWRDGLAESFYHVMSIATSGKSTRKNLFNWVGRIWAGIWMACGIAVIAYLTSSVTSVMTAISLTREVNSLADLPGRTVGVFTGSVAEQYVLRLGIASIPYDGIEEAVAGMMNNEVDAIVGDAPVLEYHAYSNPKLPVSVVGNIFHPDKYGFAVGHDDPLARNLTLRILGLHESGKVQELRLKYFGHEP